VFTIPNGVTGTWSVTVSGDIYSNPPNVNAHLYYDGADQGPVTPLAGPKTFPLPVAAGEHTIELWIGQAPTTGAGGTAPTVTFTYAGVAEIGRVPCECCPAEEAGCFGIGGDPGQPVYAFRCPSGPSTVTRWYDRNGAEVQLGDVQPCGQASQNIPVQLTLTPLFFGDGPDAAGENLCNFNHLPDNQGNWTTAGACLDPPSPSGASTLQWTTPIPSLVFEYGNPPRTSGGVVMTFSSPDLGGNITWPATSYLNPGQTVLSNVLAGGRRVLLTYLSGPLASAASGSVRTQASTQVQMHLGTTDATTPPIRVRLDFLAS
jgi:hypothetical protein